VTTAYEPDPDDAADDQLSAEIARQSTTSEEAMDAVTAEDGHVDESAYGPTPSPVIESQPESRRDAKE
jgi:hypothetical protein